MTVTLTPQYIAATQAANTWTTAGGISTLASSYGTGGDLVLFSYGLPASLPLDTEISGIEVCIDVAATSGTFSYETIKVALGVFDGASSQPLSMSAEKAYSLSGIGTTATTIILGSVSDLWGKEFWTRKELLWGTPPQFGLSIRRLGTTGIKASNISIVVSYTLKDTLTGSRAPAPFSGLPISIPRKADGSGDESSIKSADINLLGDALYNLEKATADHTDLTNDIKAVSGYAGENLVAATVYVSGYVMPNEPIVFFEEIVNDTPKDWKTPGRNTVHNVQGITYAATAVPSLPDGTQSVFEYLTGTAYAIDSDDNTYPLSLVPGSLAIRRSKGAHSHRLSFSLMDPYIEGTNTNMLVGDYSGIYLPTGYPMLGVLSPSNYTVDLDSPNGATAIRGMDDTQSSTTPSSSDPQAFRVSYYVDSTTDRHLSVSTHDGSGIAGGYKLVTKTDDFDYALFEASELLTYDIEVGGDRRRLIRCGPMLHVAGPVDSVSGYGLMITSGARKTGDTDPTPLAVAWIVKMSGLDLTTQQGPDLSTLSSPTHYETFPATTGLTNLGSTYIPVELSSLGLHCYELRAVRGVGIVVLSLIDIYKPTGDMVVLLSAVDSSPLAGTRCGIFSIPPIEYSNMLSGVVGLEGITFGFTSGGTVQPIRFEARMQGIGRLVNATI